jgi:hypothetical protein
LLLAQQVVQQEVCSKLRLAFPFLMRLLSASLGNPLFLIKARMQVCMMASLNSTIDDRAVRHTLLYYQLALNILTRIRLTHWLLFLGRKNFEV